MTCQMNFICPLYATCGHKNRTESCVIYKDLTKPTPKKFIPFPQNPSHDSSSEQFDPLRFE